MGNTLRITAVTIFTLGIQWIYSGAAIATTAPTLSTNRFESAPPVDAAAERVAARFSAEQMQNSSSTYVPPVEDGPDRSQGSGTR
jgi:hypothetical protein